jgi:hypothetical protein
VLIRSSIPFRRGERLRFPEVNPKGFGEVDTFLRIVKATREPIAPEGTSGLLPVAPTAVPDESALKEVSPLSAGLADGSTWSYHVDKKGGTLWVRKLDETRPEATGAIETRVAHADLSCTVASDGSVLGLGRYDLEARPGPFLALMKPEGAEPLWASVNGITVQPLEGKAGRWEIPLNEAPHNRVAVLWHVAPAAPRSAREEVPLPLVLPAVEHGTAPVIVAVRAPADRSPISPTGQLTASSVEEMDLSRAAWLEREITALLEGLDRSQRREGEKLVALLVKFGLTLRQAERSARYEPLVSPVHPVASPRQGETLARALRTRLRDELESAALEEFDEEAGAYLGTLAPAEAAETPPSPDTSSPIVVRPIGRLTTFRGLLPAARPERLLSLTPVRANDREEDLWRVGLILASVGAPLLVWWGTRAGSRSPWPSRLVLSVLFAALGLAAGPAWFAGGIGLAVMAKAGDV